MKRALPQNHNISIIYAEDEPIVRWSVSDDLRQAGFIVHEAANGAEAMDLVAEGIAFSAVITDINMPGAPDGGAFAQFIMREHPSVPVIVTSSSLPADLQPSLFMTKPFSTSRLVDFLAGQLLSKA